MTQLEEIALVRQARTGKNRALETLIDEIVNETDDKNTYTKLQLYAFRASRGLRYWNEDDIISRMREIVWKCVMGCWDWKLGVSLRVLCWLLLKRAVANQARYEQAKKRQATFCELNEAYHSTVAIRFECLGTEIAGDSVIEIDKLRDDLEPNDKLILNSLLAGYTLSEVAKMLSTTHNQWTIDRVKKRIRAKLATNKFHECLTKAI